MTVVCRTLRRETATQVRDAGKFRPIVVEVHPGFIVLWLKGCRQKYSLGYQAAYN